MHFELQRAIRKVSHEYLRNGVSHVLSEDEINSDWLARPKIETCPAEMSADLACPISFEIASMFRKNGARADCRQIAEEISTRLASFLTAQGLSAEVLVEGGGYINVLLGDSLKDAFIRSLIQNGGVSVLNRQSLLFEALVDCDVELVAIDFEQLVTERSDEELSAFWAEHVSRGWKVDEALLLLAMLADRELSIAAFKQGLSSRENVPWYLRRFGRDCRYCLECLGRQKRGTEDSRFVSQYLSEVENELQFFRGEVFQGLLGLHPVKLMGALMSLVRGFYKFYNHPTARALLVAEQSVEQGDFLSSLLQTIGDVVRLGIEKTEIACEKSGLVLDKN